MTPGDVLFTTIAAACGAFGILTLWGGTVIASPSLIVLGTLITGLGAIYLGAVWAGLDREDSR